MFFFELVRVMSVPKEYKMVVKKRFRIKKFNSCQILKQNFYSVSDFKSSFLQRVRFQNKIFTTCQILNQKFYNVSDFVLKNSLKIRFCTKMRIQKITFRLNLPRKVDVFKKHDSDAKNVFKKHVF